MWLRRVARDVRELHRGFADLFRAPGPIEESASYEIAASARRFSKQTKDVVDDKLAFSATLMRAGEVEAASRLMAEVEQEVLDEEAALFERVNEVKVSQAIRRERLTRLRVARMLLAALLGAGMLGSSALGAAVAGIIAEREQPDENAVGVAGNGRRHAAATTRDVTTSRASKRDTKKLRIGGVRLDLSKSEMEELMQLTAGAVDSAGLEEFLLEHLPPALAERVRDVIVAASTVTDAVDEDVTEEKAQLVEKLRPKKKDADQRKNETKDAEQKEEEQPAPDPSPTPNESEEEPKNSGDDDGEGTGGGGGDDDEQHLPDVPTDD